MTLADHVVRQVESLFPGSQGYSLEQLRAEWEAIAEEVRSLTPALAGVDLLSPAAVAATPAEAREAYLRLTELDQRHRLLRIGQAGLRPTGGHYPGGHWPMLYAGEPIPAGSGIASRVSVFFDTAALPPVSAAANTAATSTVSRLGPTDCTSRLVWLAGPGEGWMPSPAEEDERWAELEALVNQMRRDRGHRDRTKVISAGR
jgi:hypothetical protein